MKQLLSRFARNDDAATTIEYALIATGIAAALLALWPAFYSDFYLAWTNTGAVIKNAVQ